MEEYTSLRIDAILQYGEKHGFDIFLELKSGKKIKIVNANEDCREALEKYKSKGIERVYMATTAYDAFVTSVRQRLLEVANQAPIEEKPIIVASAQDILQSMMSTSGELTDEGAHLAGEITKGTVNFINSTNISQLLKVFKSDCTDAYLRSLLTAHIACTMMERFSWSNDMMKEKVAMAAVLCDITLSPADFKEISEKKNRPQDLSIRIKEHPSKIAAMVKKQSNIVSAETITIIEQHHERPNGTGYPAEITYKTITPLSAVYIVSSYFVEQIFDVMNDPDRRGTAVEILTKTLSIIKEKYYSGHFRKASEALEASYGDITSAAGQL